MRAFGSLVKIPNHYQQNVRKYQTTRNLIRGVDYIKDNHLNKSLGFTLAERQALGIHGLLAAQFRSMEDQLEVCKISLARFKDDLNRYLYLAELLETNEKLFFNLLNSDIEQYMPIVYTPTVGLACQRFGLVYRRPHGLFVTIHDKGHIVEVLKNWPNQRVRAICFTDGERILGLGDLGAYGMAIPIGKLSLYTALGGIKPGDCLPVVIDVGTDTQAFLEDPLYIGLRQPRVKGKEFDDFMDEFMHSCRAVYGGTCVLQFEDFALRNATRLLDRYKTSFCTFNDDIQGTAAVAVAGLIAATRITKKKLSENVFLFLGAGSASTGIGKLLVEAMKEEGLSEKDAHDKIWLYDIDGLLSTNRECGVPEHAKEFAKNVPPVKKFTVESVASCKATVLIGCSTVGGAFTPEILKQMTKNCKRPTIFALSNPTTKAECTPQQAYDHTEGCCIYASGSPFPPVKYNGKEYHTGQGNNSYIFPGVALGVMSIRSRHIPDAFFLTAAKAVANMCSEADLEVGRVYPPLTDLKKASMAIAIDVAKQAYELNIAARFPPPVDIPAYIKKHQYKLAYDNYIPKKYNYPTMPKIKVRSYDQEFKRLVVAKSSKEKDLEEGKIYPPVSDTKSGSGRSCENSQLGVSTEFGLKIFKT